MRIVYNISRLNWYRVLSAAIDESLRRGHDVECWHARNDKLGPNAPDRKRVPVFNSGKPDVAEYCSVDDFMRLCRRQHVDAIVDVGPPPETFQEGNFFRSNPPKWIWLTDPDSLAWASSPKKVLSCSLFALKSNHERACILEDKARNMDAELRWLDERATFVGGSAFPIIVNRLRWRWDRNCVEHFLRNSVCTGMPAIDTIRRLDRVQTLAKWGFPSSQPIVGLLASPYTGHAYGGAYEKAFVTRVCLRRMFHALQTGAGIRGTLFNAVGYGQILKGLRKYCDCNSALLVVKCRHSMPVRKDLLRLADRILVDDSFYPHSAMELFAASTVTFGFYSTGATECAAVGTPFVNIGIPFYPKKEFETTYSLFRGMFDCPGVVETTDAAAFIRQCGEIGLVPFTMDNDIRKDYVERYCGPTDGHNSERFLNALEHVVSCGTVDGLQLDKSGFVSGNVKKNHLSY